MAQAYSAAMEAATANPRTIAMLISATTRRALVDAFVVSFPATPADNSILVTAQRFTVSGSATSVTVSKHDGADGANQVTAEENATVEPTLVANDILFEHGINQRSIFTRQYAPGKELVTNTSSDNGIGWAAEHASATPTCAITVDFTE